MVSTTKERPKAASHKTQPKVGPGVITEMVMPRNTRGHDVAPKRRGRPPNSKLVPSYIPRRVDLEASDSGVSRDTFAGRVAYYRLSEGMTQQALGDALAKFKRETGGARCRGSISNYETGKMTPSIDVIEGLAKILKLSPAYLAFGDAGERGEGVGPGMVSLKEITYGRDGSYESGQFALPKQLAESYVDDLETLKVFVLNHHAPVFDLRAGDRVFADTSINTLSPDFDTYLIEVNGGMEMIRVAPSFAKSPTAVVEGGRGEKAETRVRDLKIIGGVVSTLRSE